MNKTMRIRMIVDTLMTVLILVLMAYQITGQFLHEIAGTVMIVLFITHNILNRKWYQNLFKGKYNANRIWGTIINFCLVIIVVLLAYSGIMMSSHVFSFIPGRTGTATARLIHLAASYHGFVLISIHLGNHWGMMMGMFHKMWKLSDSTIRMRIFQGVGYAIAIYGGLCFFQSGLLSYMFLTNQFVFFDRNQSTVLFFLQYLSMMGFFVFIGYFISKGLHWLSGKTKKESSNKSKIKRSKNQVKKIKKRWIVVGIIIVLAMLLFFAFGLTYIRRHFVTNKMDVDKIVNGSGQSLTQTTDSKVLTVYFTRLGNTDFEENVDIVSSASLITDGDTTYGNAEVLAKTVQNIAGGDLYTISTKKKYASSYGDTVREAKEELDGNERPELVSDAIDLNSYETIVLVYPLWWGTVPMPVATFLEYNDFEGKTVLPLVTHGGSGFGSSLDDLEKLCDGRIGEGLEIYDDEIEESREKIAAWLNQ